MNPLPMKPTPSRALPVVAEAPPPPPLPRAILHRDARLHHVFGDTESLKRSGRAAIPRSDRHVADVADILPADRAREESRRRHVSEAIEERDAVGHALRRLRGPGDVVEDLPTLRIARVNEGLREALPALRVQPGEAILH